METWDAIRTPAAVALRVPERPDERTKLIDQYDLGQVPVRGGRPSRALVGQT